GNFAVVWESFGEDSRFTEGIFARTFDAAGGPQGDEFQVNSNPGFRQFRPAVAADAINYLVTWSSLGQDGDNFGVFAQQVSAVGPPLGTELRVNTTTAGAQGAASVAVDPSGDAVVVWSGNGPGDATGVFAQRFAPRTDTPTATPVSLFSFAPFTLK